MMSDANRDAIPAWPGAGGLGRRVMSLISNQPKELALHPVEGLWVSVPAIPERLQEAKRARAAKGPKDHRQGIERSPAAEVVKRHARQRETPPRAL